MNIGIDIDGVLADYTDFMWIGMPIFCKENGVPYNPIDKPVMSDRITFNISKDLEDKFWASDEAKMFYFDRPARLYAKEVLEQLRASGHKIYIITSRSEEENPLIKEKFGMSLEELTLKWLHTNEIPYDYFFFNSKDKINILKKHNIQYMLDDNPHLVSRLKDNLPECSLFLFDSTINHEIENSDKVKRVYSFMDFYEKLFKKIGE